MADNAKDIRAWARSRDVRRWTDLKGYILPSVVLMLIGSGLLYFKFNFLAWVFFLAGPGMIYCTALEIRKAIKKDRDRGYYCPECNDLLRYKEV